MEENSSMLIASPICHIIQRKTLSFDVLEIMIFLMVRAKRGLNYWPLFLVWNIKGKKWKKDHCDLYQTSLLLEGVKPYANANASTVAVLVPRKTWCYSSWATRTTKQFFFIKTAMPLSWLEVLINPRIRSPFCKNCIT